MTTTNEMIRQVQLHAAAQVSKSQEHEVVFIPDAWLGIFYTHTSEHLVMVFRDNGQCIFEVCEGTDMNHLKNLQNKNIAPRDSSHILFVEKKYLSEESRLTKDTIFYHFNHLERKGTEPITRNDFNYRRENRGVLDNLAKYPAYKKKIDELKERKFNERS